MYLLLCGYSITGPGNLNMNAVVSSQLELETFLSSGSESLICDSIGLHWFLQLPCSHDQPELYNYCFSLTLLLVLPQ